MKKFILLFIFFSTILKGEIIKYVVVSFDGSRSIKMWKNTLNFAKSNNIHFSYFISAPYFVQKYELKNHPYKVRGRINYSWLSFVSDKNTNILKQRVLLVDRAIKEGNTIGSHSVGHFYGEKFSTNEWNNELSFFKWVMDSRKKVLNLNISFNSSNIIGYRAPNLSMNSNGYYYLQKYGYKYDASLANPNYDVRFKYNSKLPIFPLSMLNIEGKRTVILMDYNFYYWDSKAKEITNEELIIKYQTKYRDYLLDELKYGRRKVVLIGNHFSLWNGASYRTGLKDFIKQAINLYGNKIKFISFNELYNLYIAGKISIKRNKKARLLVIK